MALQFSTTLRTNQAAQIQTTVGTAASTLVIYSTATSIPANCATANATGAVALVTISLPATFLTSSAGATTLAGTWTAAAAASGTASFFRIIDNAAACHVQGTVAASGADLNINNTNIASGQSVSVTSFGVTIANS